MNKRLLATLTGVGLISFAVPAFSQGDASVNRQLSERSDTYAAVNGEMMAAPRVAAERIFSKLHSTNLKEINMSRIALEKSNNPAVKNFAQTMIAAHTDAEQQLQMKAAQLQVSVREFIPATQFENWDARMDVQTLRRLQTLTGPKFDREFVADQVYGHKMVLQWLRENKALIVDSRAEEFINAQIVVVTKHYKMAKELERTLPTE